MNRNVRLGMTGAALVFVAAAVVHTKAARVGAGEPPLVPPISQEAAEALLARDYATYYGVSTDEALSRLRSQAAVGELDATLTEHEADIYAGLWIEHRPTYRVVAAFTADGAQALTRRVSDGDLLARIQVSSATLTLAELEQQLHSLAAKVDSRHASLVGNVQENRLDVQTTSVLKPLVEERYGGLIPEAARIVEVEALPKPAANIYSGLAITTCTTGFGIRRGAGPRGILTAGHCQNAQSYAGSSLPFQDEQVGGVHDEQWHTTPNFFVKNWARYNDAGNAIQILSKTTRANQPVGGTVCKYGKVTKFDCGEIVTKLGPSCTDPGVFFNVKVHRDGVDLASQGDSGAGWFTFPAGSAYGIMSCEQGDDGIYVAEDVVEQGLGVTILTSP